MTWFSFAQITITLLREQRIASGQTPACRWFAHWSSATPVSEASRLRTTSKMPATRAIPSREVCQWRATIQQRRVTVNQIVSVKNRIRALLKANGLTQPLHKGRWWKAANL